MFTGIIETTGYIQKRESHDDDMRLWVASETFDLSDVKLGDSIAVNGVCLTVIDKKTNCFAVDVSKESLQRTCLGMLADNERVNLEKALRLQDRLGGHLVSGHVDGVGLLKAVLAQGRSTQYRFSVPLALQKYMVEKGSLCIDGVSLTINEVFGQEFCVNIIPHTLERTHFCQLKVGAQVNIEIDMLARYLEGLLRAGNTSNISLDYLRRCGFVHE